MVQDLSDADSSATHGSRSRTSAKRPDTSLACMTASNPSSDNCQDGKQAKTSGTSRTNRPKLPRPSGPPPQCPRCSADPSNTKFCYYNNYNINQPRYYCKACQRHWTDGGTLRKVETGAGKRNSRRSRGNGSVTTSEAAAEVHNKYARVTRDVPQQNWPHENFMPHRAQSIPMVAGAAPAYFDTAMVDHNSSDANMSFQEGSSFNPDKVMLDEDIDTAQAMADLDVIFANDRLDAILGSAQPLPNDGDASLGTMLGLEVLEDLANTYPSDTDFQQAMDGLSPPADSSKMLQGTIGSVPSGNLSGSQSEHMLRPPENNPHNPPPVSEPNILPSPTLRSPAPTPPPGVNVGAAFRNHGRPATDEPTSAEVMANGTSNLPAQVLQSMAPMCSEEGLKAPQSCTPASYNTETPSEGGPRPRSSTPTRAPSEEATLATIVDKSGGSQSMPRSTSWREVQMGCASGGLYPERGGSWTTPGAHMVAPSSGQPGVVMPPGATGKYPAVSGAAITSGGMMAVPLGVHGNGQAYAMPQGGFQQFVTQPSRGPQQVQGGYYMPAQPMSGVRLRPTGHMQQQQVRQMAPGGYYIMHCDPQHAGAMQGMPTNAAAAAAAHNQQQQQHQARRSPHPMQQQSQQQQQQQKSPGAGGAVQVMSSSLDGSGSLPNTAAQGTPQEQAAPNQMFSMDPNQQVVLRHHQQQMYQPAAAEQGAVATGGAQQLQMPAGSLQGAPRGTQLLPMAAAHSRMYISPQGDAAGGAAAAAAQRAAAAPAEQGGGACGTAAVQLQPGAAAARNQAAAMAAAGGSSGMVGSQLQGSASACSSNPSAASSQSNTMYVDFRQGAVMPSSGGHQPASPAAAQQQRQQPPHQPGQLRGPVFCFAPQWQHAGRPVYTLQQLQHHSAPVCYVQGSYMPRGQPTMYQHPSATGHRSPRDSAADQGSEEPEQDQHVLDATTAQ